jgi:hypothetical protein
MEIFIVVVERVSLPRFRAGNAIEMPWIDQAAASGFQALREGLARPRAQIRAPQCAGPSQIAGGGTTGQSEGRMKSFLVSGCASLLLLSGCRSGSSQHKTDMQTASPLDMARAPGSAAADMATGMTARDFGELPDGASPGDMAMATTTIPTVGFSSTLVDVAGGAPIAGAAVCVYQHPELACATSDAQGAFTARIPANARTGILIDKSGYASVLIPVPTSTSDWSGSTIRLPTFTSTQTFYSAAGATYLDAGKGFLGVFITLGNTQTGYGNTTVSLVPASGTGPYYAGTSGTYDSGLTATSAYGFARFAALAPATLEVAPHCGAGTTEAVAWGWPDASGSTETIDVPIAAGYETHVGFGCF